MQMSPSREMLIRLLVPALGLFVAAGCQTISNSHTATPVEKGRIEVSGSASGSFPRTVPSSVPADAMRAPFPEGNARVGLTDNLDVGFRAGTQGYGGDINYAPYVGPNFALSVNPEFLTQRFTMERCVFLSVLGGCPPYTHEVTKGGAAVLADVLKTELVTLTLGAKGGIWGDHYDPQNRTRNADDASPLPSSTYSPYTGVKAGMEMAHRGMFVRAHYNNRTFLDWNPHWEGDTYHVMTVATGYRFF